MSRDRRAISDDTQSWLTNGKEDDHSAHVKWCRKAIAELADAWHDQRKETKNTILTVSSIAVAVLLAFGGFVGKTIADDHDRITVLENQPAAADAKEAKVEAKAARVEAAKATAATEVLAVKVDHVSKEVEKLGDKMDDVQKVILEAIRAGP